MSTIPAIKVPVAIMAVLLAVLCGLQSWMCSEIVALKVAVAMNRCHCGDVGRYDRPAQSAPTARPGTESQNRFEFTHKGDQ